MLELCQSLLGGVKYTLGLFFVTALLSLPLGFAMSYLRRSRFALVRGVTGVYVWLLRGTPLLLQLFFI